MINNMCEFLIHNLLKKTKFYNSIALPPVFILCSISIYDVAHFSFTQN